MSRSYWTWRSNPALTIPTMFSTGLQATVESIIGIFGLALVVRLEGTSWLAQIANDYQRSDFSGIAGLVSSPAFVLVIIEYLLPAALLAAIVFIIASGFVYSAEYGSYWQARGGSHVGTSEVMARFVEKWKPMAWTMLLSNVITFVPVIASLGLTILLAYHAPTPITYLETAIPILAIGFALTTMFALFFIFTPVAVAAESLSGLDAMRRSWGKVRSNLRTAFAYGIVYLVLTVAVAYGTSAIPIANLPLSSFASVGVLILVIPVLHLTKTEIYAETLTSDPVEFVVYKPFFPDLGGQLPRSIWSIFKKGLGELRSFALDPHNLGYHALSAAGLFGGLLLGRWIGEHGLTQTILALGYAPGRINPLVSSAAPFTTGVYIFFHNWEASLATALSGVWLPIIPFAALMLNGALVGIVSDLVPNTTMLAAALLPHGIIEIPSFVLAGSAGVRLGVVFIRSVKNPDAERVMVFHRAAKQTVYLIIGLALLFFIAGLIEGNVTPVIMRMYGWT